MSGTPVQAPDREKITRSWLKTNTRLPDRNRDALASLVAGLCPALETDRNIVLGIAGAPGSGKTTLARALAHCLGETGTPSCCLSLDDYYLGRSQRAALARRIHPLYRRRGAPGTHDLKLLREHLERIAAGSARNLQIPVFDKSTDDRLPEDRWRRLEQSPRITLLEGWCVGAPPPGADSLHPPCNRVEQDEDPDGAWRRAMHAAWTEIHGLLEPRLDRLWYIRIPDWNHVVSWRWQQERQLETRNLAGPAEVDHFLGTFERVINHMQASCEHWADRIFEAGRDHEISLPDENR